MVEVTDQVRRYLKHRAEGKAKAGYADVYYLMVRKFGYPYKIGALYRHIQQCESELHGQIRAKGF